MPYQVCISILFLFLLGIMHISVLAEKCTNTTCLYGGICDSNSTGKQVRCNCPNDNKTDYGPRCEIVTRSYKMEYTYGTLVMSAMTYHGVSNIPFYPNKLVITLDLLAHCLDNICLLFVIEDSKKNHLFKIARNEWCQTCIWSPPAAGTSDYLRSLTIPTYGKFTGHCHGHWESISVHMWKEDSEYLTTRFQVCSQKNKQCTVKSRTEKFAGDLMSKFKNSRISIGTMVGCIRFPRINGAIVDLGKNNIVHTFGEVDRFSSPFCSQHAHSCLRMNPLSMWHPNHCGANSLCEGEVQLYSRGSEPCKCRCINDRRRQLETITNNDMCTSKPEPLNECKIETPIINTGPSNFAVQWTTNTNGLIGVGLKFITIELSLKTLEMNVNSMIALVSGKNKILFIQISNGLPKVCTEKLCYNFPMMSVADGGWHSLHVSIRNMELIAMLNMRTEYYVLDNDFLFPGVKVELSIPNSCIRSIRLSNIYMPTGDRDGTMDHATFYIKPHMGSGVEALSSCKAVVIGKTGTNTGQDSAICKRCTAEESCDASSGLPHCVCKNGLYRDINYKCSIELGVLTFINTSCGNRLSLEFVQVVVFANCIIASVMILTTLIKN